MPFYYLVILALVQGITEFLPISSSGHLVLVHAWLGEPDEMFWQDELMLDIAVHVGSLFAVLLYFRKDIIKLVMALLPGHGDAQTRHFLVALIIGTIPVFTIGFILYVTMPEWMRSLHVIGWCLILFGILLWVVDQYCPKTRTLEKLTYKHALFIGLAQVLSLIPGTSRSGITMTAGRYLGFERVEAARFSLLLSIPAVIGAGALGSLQMARGGDIQLGIDALVAAMLAFFAAYAALALMMRWLKSFSFTPFVIYRVALGALLLGLLYSGTI